MSKNEDSGGSMVYLLSIAMAIATGFMAGRTKKEEEQLPIKKKEVEDKSKKLVEIKQEEVIIEEPINQKEILPIVEEVMEPVEEVVPIVEEVIELVEEVLPIVEEIQEEPLPIQEEIIEEENLEMSESTLEQWSTKILASIDEKIAGLLEVIEPVEEIQEEVIIEEPINQKEVLPMVEEIQEEPLPIQEEIIEEENLEMSEIALELLSSKILASIDEKIADLLEAIEQTEEVVPIVEEVIEPVEEVLPMVEEIQEEPLPIQEEIIEEENLEMSESAIEQLSTKILASIDEKIAGLLEVIEQTEEVVPIVEEVIEPVEEEIVPIVEEIQEEPLPIQEEIIEEENLEMSESALEQLSTKILASIDEKIANLLEVMKSHEVDDYQEVKQDEDQPKSVVELLNTRLETISKDAVISLHEEGNSELGQSVPITQEIEHIQEEEAVLGEHIEKAMQHNNSIIIKQEEILEEISTEAINEIIQAIEMNKGNGPIEEEIEEEIEAIELDVDIKISGQLSKETINRFINKVIQFQPKILMDRVRHIVICSLDEFNKFEIENKNNAFANANDMCIYCTVSTTREEMTHNLAHIFDYYDGYHCYSNSRMFLRLFDECKGLFDLINNNLESTDMKTIDFNLTENSQEFFAECSQLYFNDSFGLAKECLKVYRYLHTTYTQIGE